MYSRRKRCNGTTAKLRQCARVVTDSNFCPQHQPAYIQPIATYTLADVLPYVAPHMHPRDIVSTLGTCNRVRKCDSAWSTLHKYMFKYDFGDKPTMQAYVSACASLPPQLQPLANRIIFQRSEQYVRDCLRMLPPLTISTTNLHACLIEDWIADKPKLALIDHMRTCADELIAWINTQAN